MELNEFVKAFAAEFDETPEEQFTPDTVYKELDEWGSLVALSIISMVDDEFDKVLAGSLTRLNSVDDCSCRGGDTIAHSKLLENRRYGIRLLFL